MYPIEHQIQLEEERIKKMQEKQATEGLNKSELRELIYSQLVLATYEDKLRQQVHPDQEDEAASAH